MGTKECLRHGIRWFKVHGAMVGQPKIGRINTSSKTARKVNSSRSMGMSARSQFTNTARSGLSTSRRSDASSLAERSRRAFDYDREPFLDPRFSARTHESSARSITARTETTRAEVEIKEKKCCRDDAKKAMVRKTVKRA